MVDPAALFDIQVKRIHEYKRQHLNVLHIITLYNRAARETRARRRAAHLHLRRQGGARLLHGQADHRLINGVAEVVNADPAVDGRLKVVFFPDFNVKNAHAIYPAADLSEQISTAGKEASGTGNMKFVLNGALTIGTLDGANVEIREEVGAENFFLFGLTADEVERASATAIARAAYYEGNAELREALDLIADGTSPAATGSCSGRWSTTCSVTTSTWCSPTTPPTSPARSGSSAAWRDPERWTRMSILNVARDGQVLLRPRDPRVLRGDLERGAGDV